MLVEATPSDTALIVVAAITAVPATIAAVAAILSARASRGAREQATGAREQATAANQAVNDVGPDAPKLRDLVADTNAAVLALQADVAGIQHDRVQEALERGHRQQEHDEQHRAANQALADIAAQLAAYAPVITEWRRTHPEIRPDLDDDGGQT